jgi:uncharacterized protein (TIGR00730 family)
MRQLKMFMTSLMLISVTVTAQSRETLTITLTPELCEMTTLHLPDGSIPSPETLAKDAYCAQRLLKSHAPKGAITIFGSARTKPDQDMYQLARDFAFKWTQKWGHTYPILTGGGRGIMEAGNRGAFEAKGKSLSIGTRFSSGMEKPNLYTTHSYMATSFAQREADLVDYARAIVVLPGGFGTEWEVYESLSKVQTRKKNQVPVILLGGRRAWTSLILRIEDMKAQGTIAPADVNLYQAVDTADQAVLALEQALGGMTENTSPAPHMVH